MALAVLDGLIYALGMFVAAILNYIVVFTVWKICKVSYIILPYHPLTLTDVEIWGHTNGEYSNRD